MIPLLASTSILEYAVEYAVLIPSISISPFSFAKDINSTQLSLVIAIGDSQITCFPNRSARFTSS